MNIPLKPQVLFIEAMLVFCVMDHENYCNQLQDNNSDTISWRSFEVVDLQYMKKQ